jgi:hypothetical protein
MTFVEGPLASITDSTMADTFIEIDPNSAHFTMHLWDQRVRATASQRATAASRALWTEHGAVRFVDDQRSHPALQPRASTAHSLFHAFGLTP